MRHMLVEAVVDLEAVEVAVVEEMDSVVVEGVTTEAVDPRNPSLSGQ